MKVTLLDGTNFDAQRRIVQLFRDIYPVAPVLHQALTGVAGMSWYTCEIGAEIAGAAILKSPEAVIPIGLDVKPIAYVVSDLVTDPKYRRRGVARALLRALSMVAYQNGGRILYLYAASDNEAANRLYSSSGFERLEDQTQQAIYLKLLRGNDGTDGS